MRLTCAALLLLFTPFGLAAATTAPPDTFTVELEHDETRTALKVVPRADGTVALTHLDGTAEYVAGSRIRSVHDQNGVDLTTLLQRDHQALGTGRRHKPAKPVVYTAFRFRPGPPNACGYYMITETSFLMRENSTNGGYVLIEYGLARNVGKTHSIGLTGFFGVNEDLEHSGVRLRLTQWLSPSVSVNVSPGIILSGRPDNGYEFRSPQFAAQAGVNLSGRFGFVMEMFTSGLRRTYGLPNGTDEVNWHLGFRLGAEPGLVGTVAGVLVGGMMVAAGD